MPGGTAEPPLYKIVISDVPSSRMGDFGKLRLLETSVVIRTDRKLRNIRSYGGKLEELQKDLNAARPH
jgi:hypothetical protein